MNLKHASDVSAIAAAMLLQDEEKEVLGVLPVGSAVVKLQGRWPRAFRIQVPHKAIPKGRITDARLAVLMRDKVMRTPTPVAGISAPAKAEEAGLGASPEELSEGERSLVVDVLQYPLSGVVERYRRLGVSRRKGTTWKESCVGRDLLQPVDIPTRSGRITLLQITQPGKRALRELGHEVPDRSRWGSLEHEYWKQKVAERFQSAGYEVRIEEPVNGFTDLIAKKGPVQVAVEIETGKSDWQANLGKNVKRGFTRILIITTNESTHREITAHMEQGAETKTAEVIQAQELVESRDLGLYDL